jgi:2-pyrone-4,6-dicarboxylate lactonase
MSQTESVKPGVGQPPCQPPDPFPGKPATVVPANACDCHAHIFGDPRRYPYVPNRRYTPAAAGIDEYRAVLGALGLERAVIIQPTIYTDNQITIDALAASGGKWRGIAVLDRHVSESELQRLHEAGFRGVRFHPKRGNPASLENLEAVCERIAPFGWHAQFHLDAKDLSEIGSRMEKLPVACVIDHIGHMAPAASADLQDPGFLMLLRWLKEEQAWVKLSAPNRFGDPVLPYPSVTPFAQALAAANPRRVVWASDWPHSSYKGRMPNDADLLDLLAVWVPDDATRNGILVDNPARLYDF